MTSLFWTCGKGEMTTWFSQLSAPLQALLATCYTFGMTALGTLPVFFTSQLNPRLLATALGMAAGVMLAASFWSLLAPAIAYTNGNWMPVAFGFLLGAVVLLTIDALLPHIHPALRECPEEGLHTHWKRSILLVLAVILHNIPEGLTIGVAFGAVREGIPGASLISAIVLAFGIGLQNLPEGLAVAMPVRCEGVSRWRAFGLGVLSGAVEPLAAVLGAALTSSVHAIMPYALSFAAGAMIYVIFEELIPESNSQGHGHLATIGAMLGFTLMMAMEVGLG